MTASNGMTIGQVATNIGVSPATVRRYIRHMKMQAYRIGGRWRVPEEAVEAFLVSCNERAAQTANQ
jgi:excisionase family DNA binding protein